MLRFGETPYHNLWYHTGKPSFWKQSTHHYGSKLYPIKWQCRLSGRLRKCHVIDAVDTLSLNNSGIIQATSEVSFFVQALVVPVRWVEYPYIAHDKINRLSPSLGIKNDHCTVAGSPRRYVIVCSPLQYSICNTSRVFHLSFS